MASLKIQGTEDSLVKQMKCLENGKCIEASGLYKEMQELWLISEDLEKKRLWDYVFNSWEHILRRPLS